MDQSNVEVTVVVYLLVKFFNYQINSIAEDCIHRLNEVFNVVFFNGLHKMVVQMKDYLNIFDCGKDE